jgi:aminoglycoside phosphotransferase (APT) family kinase protein
VGLADVHGLARDEVTAPGLGARIDGGRTAEVFALGADQVVKLLRPGMPDVVGEREARVAALIDQTGIAAPKFGGTTRVDGRFGLVYERLVGPSMLEQIARNPLAIDRLADEFAGLHAAMHRAAGDGLLDHKTELRRMVQRAGDALPPAAAAAALRRLEALPDGRSICHGDMHPGNVLMTARGPVVIDWMTSSCGRPAGDVARTLFLLRDSVVPGYLSAVRRGLVTLARRRFASVYLRRYLAVAALDLDEVRAWRLPVLAARLGEGITEEEAGVRTAIERELEGDRR